ncbi:MAG: hypothetical protein AAF333_05190 [Planctomycetota bacterium]
MRFSFDRPAITNASVTGLLLVALAHSVGAQGLGFVAPTAWTRGDALTTFQEWDNFTTTQGATPDASDNNPDGPALLTENTTGFVTSTGNIYSFNAATDFDVTVPVADVSSPEEHDLTVIVQTQTLGSALDTTSVVIQGAISGDIAPVASALLGEEVLGDPGQVGGGVGEFRWFLFNVPYAEFADGSGSAADFNLSFNASESSMSLDRLLIDTALRPASEGFFSEPNPVSESLDGDYDGDGFVSQADLNLVLLNWGESTLPDGWAAADQFDGGLIGQNELNGVLLNWGSGEAPSFAAVPEPGGLALAGAAALPLLRRRLRR